MLDTKNQKGFIRFLQFTLKYLIDSAVLGTFSNICKINIRNWASMFEIDGIYP